MMKYNIPTIKITSFFKENVVTEASSQVTGRYVEEAQGFIVPMSQAQYKARVESIKTILAFSDGS